MNTLLNSSGADQEHIGYYEDGCNMEATADNHGWVKRQCRFRQGVAPGAGFRPGVNFINILCVLFSSIFRRRQKLTKPKCN